MGTFSDEKQQRELFIRYHDQPGWFVQGAVFANQDKIGVGSYVQFLNPFGQTLLTGEWKRPYWEYTQAVLSDATRDRLAITHTTKPTQKLVVSVGGGVNRYHTRHLSDVLSAATAELDVVYRLNDDQPSLAVGYGFDGAYTLDQKKNLDASGVYSTVFPARTREIHSISLMGSWAFDSLTYAEGSIGYGVDRFGGQGPSIEGRITHELTPSLDGQVRAYYGIDSFDTENNLSRVGGYVRWRF